MILIAAPSATRSRSAHDLEVFHRLASELIGITMLLVNRKDARLWAKLNYHRSVDSSHHWLSGFRHLHTILSGIVRQAGCTTLLVVETPTGTEGLGLRVEEFVADGSSTSGKERSNCRSYAGQR